MLAQKPLDGNYCSNIKKWGVGALNLDKSRIPYENAADYNKTSAKCNFTGNAKSIGFGCDQTLYGNGNTPLEQARACVNENGRFPSNLLLGKSAAAYLDRQFHSSNGNEISRFFYCAKSSHKDRTESGLVENCHPTIKPTSLIMYLVRLITPKDGICLDICEGSGTHAKACLLLSLMGYPIKYIGVENDEESYRTAILREKIAKQYTEIPDYIAQNFRTQI